ncbi:MAG: zf-HC2 domain-containing protein [Gemmatimonadota bacterium]|nr:MAG: zf-HC2 domain-containing protein [Gemmatimonadota bacterium]
MEDYLKNELKPNQATRVVKHLRHCPQCSAFQSEESEAVKLLHKVVPQDENAEIKIEEMWARVRNEIQTLRSDNQLIGPLFVRRAMIYSCAAVVFLLLLTFFGRVPWKRSISSETPCFKLVSPTLGCTFEKETLKLLEPSVYGLKNMRAFLVELKRPSRVDLLPGCYSQLPAIEVQSIFNKKRGPGNE